MAAHAWLVAIGNDAVCGICGGPMLPHLGYFYGVHMDCARKAINKASKP